MPQLPGGGDLTGGDDLGANDELITFKDEGEQEEKRNVSSERDLDDVKSSLVNESESSSDSEADRCTRTDRDLERRVRQSHLFQEVLRRQQQDGGLFQPSPYVGYPFFMIPDLGNLCTPYLANAALPPSTRTFLPFQWPLLDVPGRPSITESAAQTHLSNSVPVVQHPHMSQLHPLLSYSPETFSPQRASPGFSPDTGMSRTPCYPVSPGGMAQIPHPLGWLRGQTMYPLHGGFSPAALAMNASMSSLVSGNFSPRMLSTNPSSVPHPAVPPPPLKHEARSCSQPDRSTADVQQHKEEKKPHIKKPLNAFMLYMREERPQVVSQCKVKESATINQILGQRWHSLSKEEQGRYYELARKERLLHSKLYPGWSARDNYGKKKKRKRAKSETQLEDAEEDAPPQQLKRPCVPPDEMSHTHTLLTQTAHSHPRSHLTHTHLSQASPASSLDSPATPTSALASPAAPAPTHTEHAHSFSRRTPPYGEQLQPLALTTRPARTAISMTHQAMRPGTSIPGPSTSGPSTPTSSCDTPTSSPHMAASRCSPPPSSFLVPPSTSTHQSAASSHGALFSVRKTNQL